MARTNRNLLAVLVILIFVNLAVIGFLVLQKDVLFGPATQPATDRVITPGNNIVFYLDIASNTILAVGLLDPLPEEGRALLKMANKLGGLDYEVKKHDVEDFYEKGGRYSLAGIKPLLEDWKAAKTILMNAHGRKYGRDTHSMCLPYQ